MALLEWRDEFSIGDEAVDHEHRELINQVNLTAGAIETGGSEAEIDQAFGDLLRGISAHFANEERQMRDAHYDQTEAHKDDHERLIDALRDMMDDDRDGADAATETLVKVLGDWFTDHFATHDARLHHALGPQAHG